MSDLVLGMIIGGVIGVAGSAVTALIQGRYSLKTRREDNLARHREQATQIEHEKDMQLIARLIARRSSYLEPLSSQLSALSISINNYEGNLIKTLHPYYLDSENNKIRVAGAKKEEFTQKIVKAQEPVETITGSSHKIWDASSPISDVNLIERNSAITNSISEFYKAHTEMFTSLRASTTGQDWTYDFQPVMKSMHHIQLNVSLAHRRIECLLAGIDENEQ